MPDTSPWVNYKGLRIHGSLFKRGIVAVVREGDALSVQKMGSGKNHLFINDRELSFEIASKNQTTKLFFELLNYSKDGEAAPVILEQGNCDSVTIINPKCEEEIFWPLTFVETRKTEGLYVYPWLSKPTENFMFDEGFECFVSAGCMFGSGLIGRNQKDESFAFIKYGKEFFEEEVITNVINESGPSPYEEMLFSEFKRYLVLIKKLSAKNVEPELFYHLPYYDYILFGVMLFARGRIILPALKNLIKIIAKKTEEHADRIIRMCNNEGVQINIVSPFQNLFGDLIQDILRPCDLTEEADVTSNLLKALELSSFKIEPLKDSEAKKNEKEFVRWCLKKLITNRYDQQLCEMWQDFINKENLEEISTLDSLFKTANAVVTGIAAKGKADYKVCSFLPVSEKQIQVDYAVHSKNLAEYPAVFNITALDPLFAYDAPITEGLIFYFELCSSTISKLINDKKILDKAFENIGLFSARKSVPKSERKFLPKPTRIEEVISAEGVFTPLSFSLSPK